MCLAQGPQRSDAGEARTRGPSVSSQALYHHAPSNQYLFDLKPIILSLRNARASVRRTYAVYYVQKSDAYAEITHQRRTADFSKFLSTAENGYRDVLSAEKNQPTFTRLRDLCPAFVLETHLFCLLTTLVPLD